MRPRIFTLRLLDRSTSLAACAGPVFGDAVPALSSYALSPVGLSDQPVFLEGVPGLQDKIFGYFVVEDHDLRRVTRAVDFSGFERLYVARTPDRPGGIPPIPPLKLWKLYLPM